jgi:hypothetical protein
VVAVGTSVTDPESASEVWSSDKTEGVIETESAFVVFHIRAAVCPAPTTVGAKLKVIVGAEPAATTVTVIELVVCLPCASAAVATYVVVCDGVTEAEPCIGRVPEATAGEMENELALVTFHVSVVGWPCTMLNGCAPKAITACDGPELLLFVPPQPQRQIREAKQRCTRTDIFFDRSMALSQPGLLLVM